MASPNNTINNIPQKKPVLVINKKQLYIPQFPIMLKTPLKRPITKDNYTAKRSCLSVANVTLIINQTEEQTTSLNTNVSANKVVSKKEKPDRDKDSSIYNTSRRCLKHGTMPEHHAEGLVQIGYSFESIKAFQDYTAMYAKTWYFYYTRYDSRNLKTSANYDPNKSTYLSYGCRFNRKNYKSQSKGIRKRSSLLSVTCPAGITLKCSADEDLYKVQAVCHHHSHELSADIFSRVPHGYRLPQEIKDEIRDLALFNVDPVITDRYIRSKIPGLKLKKTVYNTYAKVKSKNTQVEMSSEKITKMIAKIKHIKENFSISSTQNKAELDDDSSPHAAKKSRKTYLIKDTKSQQNSEISTEINADAFENSIIKTTRTYYRIPTIEREESISILSKPESILIPSNDYETDITIQNTVTFESDASNSILCRLESENATSIQVINELSEENTIADQNEKQLHEVINLKDLTLPYDRKQMRCHRRHSEMPEYHAEGLIKEGDIFSSIQEFASYAAEHALKWFFYYQIYDSRNVKTSNRYNNQQKTRYHFACRFDKGRYKSQSTGVRKIKQKTIQCPATVTMVCKPGEAHFTVTYACHHHSHELSAEIFSREAHGHRLSTELKDEIRELLWYQLDTRLIRQYLLQKTRFDLKRTIINILTKMRKDRIKLNVLPEREKEILEKIEEINKNFSIPKRAPSKNKLNRAQESKRSESDDDERNASRVEARLNNILYDQGLIQSIKELQETTGCEIQINPWAENDSKGVSHLQEGLEEKYEVQRNFDSYDNQIEIDQEQYSMDENVHYIIQSVDDETKFGDHSITQLSGEKMVYLNIETINDQNICEVEIDSSENRYDENIKCNVPCTGEPHETNTYLEENTPCENVFYKEDITETNVQNYETEQFEETHTNNTYGITHYEEENTAPDNDINNETENNSEVEYQTFENERFQPHINDTDLLSTNEEVTARYCGNTAEEITKEVNLDNEYNHSITVDNETSAYKDNIAQNGDENIIYIEQITDAINPDSEKDRIQVPCTKDAITCETVNVVVNSGEENINNTQEITETVTNNQQEVPIGNIDTISLGINEEEYIAQIAENTNETTKQSFDNSENENYYQMMYQYTNDDDPSIENDSEPDCAQTSSNNTNIRRDIGVQADLEILELEGEYENIKQLELNTLNELLVENTVSSSTRGRPKVVLEENIINRYNIEFYINLGGVVPCLENIAINMGISILDLLKKLYKGEAVFKISCGRSGKLDRNTVQLTYVPLTITFPFEKSKYLNTLCKYKTICSKYCNMAVTLENTVQNISADLKAANERIEIVQSQNEELINMKNCYEELLLSHANSTQLLNQNQLDIEKAHNENFGLSQKINDLEALLQEYRHKDRETPKLIEPTSHSDSNKHESTPTNISETALEQHNSSQNNTILNGKLKTLDEKSLTNI